MSTQVSTLNEMFTERISRISVRTRRWLAFAALTLCTAAGAFLVIPIPGSPVPLTLQTFFVLAGAGLLGGRLSASAQTAYLVLGGIGLPLYAGSIIAGPVFFGVTGGYLVGFVLASWLIGRLLRNTSRWMHILPALVLGELVILTCGVIWLAAVTHLPLTKAALLGALPFLPGDIAKLAAAATVIRAAGERTRRFTAR